MYRNSSNLCQAARRTLATLAALGCVAALLAAATPAYAALHNIVMGPGRAGFSSMTPSAAQNFSGTGSWFKLDPPGPKAELYISPASDLGTTFTVNDIQSITYHTYNHADVSPVEFYLALYTKGTAHGWFEQRLNGEPYLKTLPYVPVYDVWNAWTTGGGDPLTFTDHNNSGNLGFYNAPTMAQIQAAAGTGIQWSTWPGNPTQGTANTNFIDYASQEILYISLQTGSGNIFNGYLDGVTIALKNGETYQIDLEPTAGPDNVAANTTGLCISNVNTCVNVPVVFNRLDVTGVRGYSVKLNLSANLSLCNPIAQGAYLSSISGTSFQVVSNGGGNYTVDCAILGTPCGATGSGTLFTLPLASVSNGTGVITVTSVKVRDCSNAAVTGYPGEPAGIPLDHTGPLAISNAATSQVLGGNGSGGRTGITVNFTPPGDAATIEVYRAPFGNYPEYDNAPGAGSVPSAPSYPPGAPWTPTTLTASGQVDHPLTRDFWYYVVFTKDACGNVSAVSNVTAGSLDYHLGDVSNGTPGSGDNLVATIDITLLGAHYGLTGVAVLPYDYLDVGPTTTNFTNGRPLTDKAIDFEDLILFAINYGAVSKPSIAPAMLAVADRLELSFNEEGGAIAARLGFQGSGRVQGLSTHLTWNSSVVEPFAVKAGALLDQQNGVALSSAPGVVDVALMGARSIGLGGSGELASVSFRRIASGDPGIALARIDARDARNQPVAVASSAGVGSTALVTRLMAPAPSPFRISTMLNYSLAARGTVEMSIYTVAGRKIRTLVPSAVQEAGNYQKIWDGRDEAGKSVPQGIFYIRLRVDGSNFTRTLAYVK